MNITVIYGPLSVKVHNKFYLSKFNILFQNLQKLNPTVSLSTRPRMSKPVIYTF